MRKKFPVTLMQMCVLFTGATLGLCTSVFSCRACIKNVRKRTVATFHRTVAIFHPLEAVLFFTEYCYICRCGRHVAFNAFRQQHRVQKSCPAKRVSHVPSRCSPAHLKSGRSQEKPLRWSGQLHRFGTLLFPDLLGVARTHCNQGVPPLAGR